MSMQPRDVADGGPVPDEFTCDLATTPVRDVRHLVRVLLGDTLGVRADDAVLVADELASNAIQHGESPMSCRLRMLGDRGALRIEVTDAGAGEAAPRTPDRSGGRGLLIVDRLTDGWGVTRSQGHKTVWAEMVVDDREGTRRAPHLSIAPE